MDLPIAIPKNPVAWLERELIVKDSFTAFLWLALAPMSKGMMQSSVTDRRWQWKPWVRPQPPGRLTKVSSHEVSVFITLKEL